MMPISKKKTNLKWKLTNMFIKNLQTICNVRETYNTQNCSKRMVNEVNFPLSIQNSRVY